MKKIFLGLAVLGAALTSCDMDTQNYGVIGSDNGIENMNDAANFLNGIYINIRSISVGNRNSAADLQTDYFVGTLDYGNRMGNFSSQSIVASDQDIAGYYEASYNAINAANYFIPKCEALLASGSLSDDEQVKLKGMMAVAHFTRAYAYWWVFDKCVDYKESELDTPGKGLQIVTVYTPPATVVPMWVVAQSVSRSIISMLNSPLLSTTLRLGNRINSTISMHSVQTLPI